MESKWNGLGIISVRAFRRFQRTMACQAHLLEGAEWVQSPTHPPPASLEEDGRTTLQVTCLVLAFYRQNKGCFGICVKASGFFFSCLQVHRNRTFIFRELISFSSLFFIWSHNPLWGSNWLLCKGFCSYILRIMTLFGESDAVSGELFSTKCPVLMKMFLLGKNKRRNSNISEDVLGGSLVDDYFI